MGKSFTSNKEQASSRLRLLQQARKLLGAHVGPDWDWRQGDLTAIDVAAFSAGARFQAELKSDFARDPASYRKLGGVANTPDAPYFFRRYSNLIHFMRRRDCFYPRGSAVPSPGMVMVLDWPEERGRFNFSPDRIGVVLEVDGERVSKGILALPAPAGWVVAEVHLLANSPSDRLVIGYGDLPCDT
ncbi:MAG: hypothetical protein CMH55_01385 [Myxococcales bacterium]|nr:hypothetical protein [Myxococcales bacterium]